VEAENEADRSSGDIILTHFLGQSVLWKRNPTSCYSFMLKRGTLRR
jgi:hypothetical protein